VSRYGVDVATIDRFASALGHSRAGPAVYLIDEIGRMECLSEAFVDAVRRLLEDRRPIVATVAQRGAGFIDEVKHRRDVELWQVTPTTRDALPDRIVAWVHAALRDS